MKAIAVVLVLASCFALWAAPFAKADTELGKTYKNPGEGIAWKEAPADLQIYVQGEDYRIFVQGGLVYLQSEDQSESLFPASWGFYTSGQYIVSYDGENGDSLGYWRCYDMAGKREISLPKKSFDGMTSLFWADETGIYYTKRGENRVYHYDIAASTERELGKTPGQPRGVVDGKVISISFTQRQILSSEWTKGAKHKVLYQGGKDLLSMQVVGKNIYAVRAGGLYRLDAKGKLELISKGYTAIAGVSGDIFIAVRKNSAKDVGLTEEVSLSITDGVRVGEIGEINAFDMRVSALDGRISADGQRLLLQDYVDGIEYSMEIPPYENWKKLPIK